MTRDETRARSLESRLVGAICGYWLLHPVDRIVTVYRLEAARYGVPDLREICGRQPVGVLPGVDIDWDTFAAVVGS